MFEFLINSKQRKKNPTSKLLITLLVLFLYRFGNSIPLSGIDQQALQKTLFEVESKNSIMQIINMYSSGSTLLSPFSLGILPFINSSILIDLLTAVFPSLEKLQTEEGERGRKKLNFYKKVLCLVFSIIQSCFLIFYLKSYFYNTSFLNLSLITLQLCTGSLIIIWFSNLIDTKGIGNGTSVLILINIINTIIGKGIENFSLNNFNSITDIGFLFFLILLICISQTARINIDVISARQLAFLESLEKEEIGKNFELRDKGLSIKLNQAGIFPIIIASNFIPILSYFLTRFSIDNKILNNFFYYLLIIGFNYFYTLIFWDPEKISEQLRKASVSIVNITPGKATVSYLENIVKSTSIIGGIFLCFILFLYDIFNRINRGPLLTQINISSLIILVGVAYEIQKTIRVLYKNVLNEEK